MSRATAATHSDAGRAKLMADSSPGNAQLGTDLAQGPTLAVQVGCTLNVHERHRNESQPEHWRLRVRTPRYTKVLGALGSPVRSAVPQLRVCYARVACAVGAHHKEVGVALDAVGGVDDPFTVGRVGG
jgi:hypothetical protein